MNSGLDWSEVQHRLKRSEKVADLITVYQAPILDNGQRGPTSAELNDKGEQILQQVTHGDLSIKGLATPEDIDRLKAELVEVKETLSEFEDNPTGAFDDKKAQWVDKLMEMMVTFMIAFEELGVDLGEHRPDAN